MFLFRLQNYIFFLFTAIFYSLFSIFWKTWEKKNKFFWKTWEQKNKFFERHKKRRTSFLKDIRTEEQVFLKDIRTEEHVLSLNQRTCSSVLLSYPSQAIPMFFCSSVLSLASNPSCSSVLLSLKTMFSCLITMHIFLIPIKILNCFSLPFQISFILLYINILSLRKIENSIYTFYRNGTSTL